MQRPATLTLTPVLLVMSLAGTLVARAAAEPPTVSFRAICFDPQETALPLFFVAHGGARKPLEIDKSRLSERQKASVRDGHLVDFHTSQQPQEGETPAVTLTLPANSLEHLLFVFAPAKTGYRAWAIHLPPADFKAGASLLINAAPVEVAVKQGTAKPLAVKPGAHQVLSIPAACKDPMLPIQIFEKRPGSNRGKSPKARAGRWICASAPTCSSIIPQGTPS